MFLLSLSITWISTLVHFHTPNAKSFFALCQIFTYSPLPPLILLYVASHKRKPLHTHIPIPYIPLFVRIKRWENVTTPTGDHVANVIAAFVWSDSGYDSVSWEMKAQHRNT